MKIEYVTMGIMQKEKAKKHTLEKLTSEFLIMHNLVGKFMK
jgi:hypothetical protein